MAEHIVGYVLEYKSELDDDWQQHNGVVRHRTRQNEYKATVKELIESTEYFFRVKVVGKNDKRGNPSPELKATTKCGKPEEPPRNVAIQSHDYEHIKITWEPPDPETWKCDAVEYVIQYANNSNEGVIHVPTDAPNELILETAPGVKWGVKMQTQTVEEEPQKSKWSNRATFSFDGVIGGSIVLLSKGFDNLKVKWTPPPLVGEYIERYEVSIIPVSDNRNEPKKFTTASSQTDYHFKDLEASTYYNVTVLGKTGPKTIWTIHDTYSTTEKAEKSTIVAIGPVNKLWIFDKSDTMLHAQWLPPDVFEPEYRDLVTHYHVTLTPLDKFTLRPGNTKNFTVPVPSTTIQFNDLIPDTIYNVTVQAGTEQGYGELLWTTESTLPAGERNILKLRDRTPTTLTVYWEPVWGTNHKGYIVSLLL